MIAAFSVLMEQLNVLQYKRAFPAVAKIGLISFSKSAGIFYDKIPRSTWVSKSI